MTDSTLHTSSGTEPLAGGGFFSGLADFFSIRSWRLRRRLAALRQTGFPPERELVRRVSTRLRARPGKDRPDNV